MRTTSSAWLSSLAKTSVLGTSVRPGKISLNSRSRNVRTTVRIWSGVTTSRSNWLPSYTKSSSNCSQRTSRVLRSRLSTHSPASTWPPRSVTSVRMR